MVRQKTDFFLIDGKPLLVPDLDVVLTYEDLDASDSGRDESGFMHRMVIRKDVKKWEFVYSSLSQEEYAYMNGLLRNKDMFTFTYPVDGDPSILETCTCYVSKRSITWRSLSTGHFRNYKFSIVEC